MNPHNTTEEKIKDRVKLLVAELESYEQSLNFNLAGYKHILPDGKEHFFCKICGHSPALLVERLKQILEDSNHV